MSAERAERAARVVWLEQPGELVLREETLGAPGPGEVLCETIVSAISPGTELAAWRGLPPLRPGIAYPRLQGYCNVARVMECGEGVEATAKGDRVLSFASHRSHHMLTEADILYRLPDAADADGVVAAYLFHLGYNAMLRGGVRAGSSVLVIGLGALGLTSVAMARLAGAEVFAVSSQDAPVKLAREFGAQAVYARGDAALEDLGADVVITTTNGWADMDLALRAAGQNGTIACLGFPGRGEPVPENNPFDSQYFYMKQLSVEAVGWSPEHDDSRGFNRFNERANIAYLARMIETGRIDPAPILSGRYPGEDIAQAYADLDARKDDAVTYLLDWSS